MTTILIKKKDTAGAPAAGDLTNAAGGTEIAVNTATKRIYTKDSGGNVVELGTNSTSSTIDQLTVVTSTTLSYGTANQVQYLNASKLLVGSANLTFNGTTLVANDITDSSLTSGRVTYAGASGNLVDSANLTFNGTTLTANTIGAFTLSGTIAGGGNQINNVIIGTTTPLAGAFTTLTASSTLTVTGAGSIEGLTVGRGAGAVSTNTAVGASALAANTTGNNNTAVGHLAGVLISTGTANTALGSYALNATTGSDNTGIGQQALGNNTSGGQNTAVGKQAMQLNTTASNNTAVGYQAGYSITTGANNTFLGWSSGYFNQTGASNVAVGYGAYAQGGTLATGSNNIAIGDNSLRSIQSGSNNTVVGHQAGYGVNTGSRNVLIGDKAAYILSNGSENTVVGPTNGSGTGVGAALTSGSTNTFIGINAGQLTTTGSYNTVVGAYSPPAAVSNAVALSDGQGNIRFQYLNSTTEQARVASNQTLLSNVSANYGGVLRTRSIPTLGNPNGGTYKGYLILAKAYDGVVGQAASNVVGQFTFFRGGTGSGNRSTTLTVDCSTAYSESTFGVNGIDTGEFTERLVTCTYDSEQWLALETGSTNGNPDGGVYFLGTFQDAGMVYVDATYVSSISEFNSSAGLNVYNAGGALILKSGQVRFPATQNASANANTLDDYEEGAIDGNNLGLAYGTPGTSSFTYSDRVGNYTKIGRVVYFTIDIRLATFSKGTASGELFIVGLPFAQRTTSGFDSARCTVQLYNWTYTTSPIIAVVTSATTTIAISRMVSNSVTTVVDDPSGNSIIWVTGFYFV